jgi:hypothetical protein
MAKIKIPFNGTDYSIDESAFSEAADSIKSHLSTTMSGTGATINFGGTVYNIDSVKLTAATNDFVSHFGTITGTGRKVTIGGVEHNLDSNKLSEAVTTLETVLGNLHSEEEPEAPIAGLYKSGTNYTELIATWDDLADSGAITVTDGTLSAGLARPVNMPEKNEYGFYYGVRYIREETEDIGLVFYEDGTMDYITLGEPETVSKHPVTYNGRYATIEVPQIVESFSVGEDGFTLEGDWIYRLGELPEFDGDLLIPYDNSITSIGDYAFDLTKLAEVVIPAGVTSIGEGAFAGCTYLKSITLPDNITQIGWSAFSGCDNLTDVYYAGTADQWNAISINSSNVSLTNATIHYSHPIV